MRRLLVLACAAVAAVLPGCSTGHDAVAQGGTFEFVAPGGKTDIFYDPPQNRGSPGQLAGSDLVDPTKTLSIDDFAGKVVVVNVWGQWCGPCRTEISRLQKVYDATRAQGVAFLGIDVRDDERQAARDFVVDRKVTFPSIYDPAMRTMIAFGELPAAFGCRLEGDGELEISGVCGMEHASAGQLTFLANPKYAPKVKNTKASAILVSEPLRDLPIACLVSENPYLDFARALALFYQPPAPAPGIHPLAYVAPTAVIGENCSIGPFAVIGERVRIGRNAVLHPHVVIYEGAEIGDDFLAHSHAAVREFCRIGNRVILQNGVVVGGDGFGFAKRADNTHFKIVQSGVTVIEDDVEVQSLTNLDRATVGETRIRRGAKIDSLVQVGHACTVGEDNIICAQTGLAGSTVLERNVLLAGQVGSSGHLTVHEGAIVYAQSGIGGDVEPNGRISGSPAFAASEWLRAVTAFPKLPELLKAIRELKKRVDEIEKNV